MGGASIRVFTYVDRHLDICIGFKVEDDDTCLSCFEYAIGLDCQLCTQAFCYGCIEHHWQRAHGMTAHEAVVSRHLWALESSVSHVLLHSGDLTVALWHLVVAYVG